MGTAGGLRGDVYYFAPCGKKLRTYPEVTRVSGNLPSLALLLLLTLNRTLRQPGSFVWFRYNVNSCSLPILPKVFISLI